MGVRGVWGSASASVAASSTSYRCQACSVMSQWQTSTTTLGGGVGGCERAGGQAGEWVGGLAGGQLTSE